MISKIRNYLDLSKFLTFEERFNYLKLDGAVGKSTFGYDRYLNQNFYKSVEWKRIRDLIIIRDEGCDLGIPEFIIHSKIVIHHMNPITMKDIINQKDIVFCPDFLICTTEETHRAIHYGDKNLLSRSPIVRRPGDTTPWR